MCSIAFDLRAGDAALFVLCTIMGLVFGALSAGGIYLKRSKKMRAEVASERKEFLADLAHELQTPIAILRGNLEIMESGVTAGWEPSVRTMHNTLNGLTRFVASSLAGIKEKSSECAIIEAVIPVREFLDEVVEDCFILGEYNDVRISAMSEDVAIRGDGDKLKEVLLNLVSNALKHTSPGGTIALSARQKESMVEMVVADTGSGIAPEFLPHIFERFYRINDDESPGSGIGLYLCRQIIKAHRGEIIVESEPGKGSRFVVTIPIYLL
jgi:two-component system sensor histidine kinase BaeS